MWFNGFIVVVDKALEALGEPRVQRHRDAILMGAFREDVCFLGRAGMVIPSASMTHFLRPGWPGGFIPFVWQDAAQRARMFYDRAVREHGQGRQASAFVQLGRAVHPLIDMACPVHAQGVAHKSDPFEWNVEAMAKELRALPAVPFHSYGSDLCATPCACTGQAMSISGCRARPSCTNAEACRPCRCSRTARS